MTTVRDRVLTRASTELEAAAEEVRLFSGRTPAACAAALADRDRAAAVLDWLTKVPEPLWDEPVDICDPDGFRETDSDLRAELRSTVATLKSTTSVLMRVTAERDAARKQVVKLREEFELVAALHGQVVRRLEESL